MWDLICALWVGRDRASWWDLVYNILILKSPKQGKVRYFIKKYPRAIKIKGIFSPINRSHSGWGADVNIAKPDKIRYPKYCKILCYIAKLE